METVFDRFTATCFRAKCKGESSGDRLGRNMPVDVGGDSPLCDVADN